MIRPAMVFSCCAFGLGAQVSLTHIGTVDVAVTSNAANPEYIGANPSAVAWNGTDLWVAGFNNAAGTNSTAIVKVSNALTTPAFGATFGVVPATPSSRGYSGLDIEGSRLVSAHDFGTNTPDGISQWDLNGNNNWMKDGRGSSGAAFDPGFVGVVDPGTAWMTFSVGRRLLQDNTTGADLYTTANGMIVNAGSGTLWRDLDFDPLTGDIYLRRSNEIVKCERIAGNTVINNQVLVSAVPAAFVNQQNLEFVQHGGEQLIFWNDRASQNGGQLFESVIRCHRPDGTFLEIDFGTFTAAAGAAAYDFSYDEQSGTLAISDFSGRAVYIFAVSVFSQYGASCPGQGSIAPELSAVGDTRGGGAITYTAASTAPSSVGAFVFGFSRTSMPLTLPPNCLQQVTPILFSAGLYFTGAGAPGSGTGTFSLNVNPGLAGITLRAQSVILEGGSLSSVITTNGVETVLQ
ncbi:MAG: hypothetical protein NXI31_04150 [bacterium]|nr:hypothetical protein [bacterium]